jgi:hypothetical protein
LKKSKSRNQIQKKLQNKPPETQLSLRELNKRKFKLKLKPLKRPKRLLKEQLRINKLPSKRKEKPQKLRLEWRLPKPRKKDSRNLKKKLKRQGTLNWLKN